ncbi:MAG: hypothetical protein H6652_10305 [Ardenticatenaceae bacterium]|nr:hypothetical protein [Ardenticatenaceae bacterium]
MGARGPVAVQHKTGGGDRWALLGHAAGFIDPFYSKGLYSTLTAVFIVAHNLLKAEKTGDYSAAAFADVQTVTHNFVCSADRLIANSYRSFGNYKLWQVYSVMWLLGAYTELVKLNMMRAQTLQTGQDRQGYYDQLVTLKLCGGGYPEFDEVANKVDGLIEKVDPHDETAVDATVAEINQIFRNLSWIADPVCGAAGWQNVSAQKQAAPQLAEAGRRVYAFWRVQGALFGELTMWDLLLYGAKEKLLFARPYLDRQHKKKFQKQK